MERPADTPFSVAQAHSDMGHSLAATYRDQNFSPADLAQHLVIDDSIRKRSTQACILLLQLLQSLVLVNLQAAIFLAPTEAGLLRHAELEADFGHRLALDRHDFCFAQFVDDVFGCESLLGHGLTLLFNSI